MVFLICANRGWALVNGNLVIHSYLVDDSIGGHCQYFWYLQDPNEVMTKPRKGNF